MGSYWRRDPACISTFLIMILWSAMTLDELVASLLRWSVCPKILWSLVICKCFPENGKSCSPARFFIDLKELLHKNSQYGPKTTRNWCQKSDSAFLLRPAEKVLLFSCHIWQISGWAATEADGKWQPIWYLCHQTRAGEGIIWGQSSFGAIHKVPEPQPLTEKVTWFFRDSRMVGCCCEDDYQEVVWFELKKGPPQVTTKGSINHINPCFSAVTVAITSSWLTMTHWTQASRPSLVGDLDQA